MQLDKKIYIALGVLAVLAVALWLQVNRSKEHDQAHTVTAASAQLPSMKLPADDLDKITKLTIQNADKEEVTLEKRGDQWWLTKPLEAIASQQNVKNTLENLKGIEVKEAINATDEAPKMYKEYDLEADKAVHVMAFKGEDKAFDAFFGKSGSRGQMARLESKPGIWVVSGYSSYNFTRAPKDWREKQILKFEDANVVSVQLTNEEGQYSFSKNDETWSATFKGKKLDNFDQEKVKDMLRAFRNLNAQDFGDGKAAADTGLDKPVATFKVTLKDDAGTHELHFGTSASESGRYAQKPGDQTVFIVGTWAADWATAKPEKFQKPKDDKKSDKPAVPAGMPAIDIGAE